MIAIIHRSPASSKATTLARAEALKTVHGIATAHGLGSVVEKCLCDQPLASRDARGPVMRSFCRSLGDWLYANKPSYVIVSGIDLNRHVLTALRRYKTRPLTLLNTYTADDRFATVTHAWEDARVFQIYEPDAPSSTTTLIPCVTLDLYLKESHKGRLLPAGYWPDWTTSLINHVHKKARIGLDRGVASKVRAVLDKDKPEEPWKALLKDMMNL